MIFELKKDVQRVRVKVPEMLDTINTTVHPVCLIDTKETSRDYNLAIGFDFSFMYFAFHVYQSKEMTIITPTL